jgi:hypothetical protein
MTRLFRIFTVFFALIGSAFADSEVPFRLVNGFILVEARVAGRSERLTFLLDSGASATVFHLGTAKRLRLPLGARENVQGVGSEASARRLPSVPVVLGETRGDVAVLAVNLSRAQPLCGEQIDGLLGAGFFADRIVQIDYAAGKLRFLSDAPSAGGTRLALHPFNGIFCAPVSVNGSQPRWTRVDTGCNDAVHWVVPRTTEKRRRGATIGFLDEDHDLTHATVRLGERELAEVETSLHGEPLFPGEAGLLGNGVLSKYRVTFDVARGELWLQDVK